MFRLINDRHRKCVLFSSFLFLLLTLPILNAEEGVGIGISTYSIVFKGSVFDSYTASPRITNPSQYEVTAEILFDCFNCEENITIFGYRIADKVDDHKSYFTFNTDDVTVSPMSIGQSGAPIFIHFSPKIIIKKDLKIYPPKTIGFFFKFIDKNYPGYVKVPYFTIFVGEKHLKGLLVAHVYESSFGKMGVTPSVGSSLSMYATGVPKSSFIFFVVIIILLILLIFRKKIFRIRRTHKKKKIKPKEMKLEKEPEKK